jgi:hypothetical protein
VSRQGLRDRLIRSANWLIFHGWPRARRWLRVLYRLALVVALVLSLLALLVPVCQHAQSNRALRDIGAEPWTTRVWAAERAGGVTIRATTGRMLPDRRQPRRFGRLALIVIVILAVLALASTSMVVLTLHSDRMIGALIDGAEAGQRPAW